MVFIEFFQRVIAIGSKKEPKREVCIDCGKPPKRGQKLNRKGRCSACAWKAVGEAAYQLHTHKGPFYDKWRKGVKAAARRL